MINASNKPVIKVAGLSKSYSISGKHTTIYQQVAFEANAGEVTLIMGPSGSGKSSLLRQIALLDNGKEGDIYYRNTLVSKLNTRAKAKVRAKELGFIFQSFALISEFSVLENCALPLLMNGYSQAQAREKAQRFIHKFIEDMDMHKKPNELSGGEQQRVAIIRALVHEPSIIIADEPTGNLDELNANFIKTELRRMATDLGSAVVIVSHDASFIKQADAFYQLIQNESTDSKSCLVRCH